MLKQLDGSLSVSIYFQLIIQHAADRILELAIYIRLQSNSISQLPIY